MHNAKLVVVGGFLGAGKTTSILKLAVMLKDSSCKVGIVTNDQGSNLVDTHYLQEHGFPVMEVTGGCFCCNFDQLAQKLAQMSEQEYPDYILAEPVGSCTDLISTIMKPLRGGKAGRFALAPLSIVCDPMRIRRFSSERPSGFPSEINYLFSKQLEEAELIILNKCDKLSEQEITEMTSSLSARFPGIEILTISAQTGMGFDEWVARLIALENRSKRKLDVSYDTYATAEASLGWLNLSAAIKSEKPFDANDFACALVKGIKEKLRQNCSEIAHLKLYMVSSVDYCKLSCVSVFDDIVQDKLMSIQPVACNLILNIRATAAPEFLMQAASDILQGLSADAHITLSDQTSESFYPGYPKPKYRM